MRPTNASKTRQGRPLIDVQRDEGFAEGEILCLDLLFVDQHPFLISIGRRGGFIHVVPLASKMTDAVHKALNSILDDYARNRQTVVGGARLGDRREVVATHSDNEATFVSAADAVFAGRGIAANFVAAGDHVPEVERAIRTIKERLASCRAAWQWFAEGKILEWMVIAVVHEEGTRERVEASHWAVPVV